MFLQGVLAKTSGRRWLFGGELWCVDGRILGLENTPRFLNLFLEIPVLGMGG